MRVKTLIAVIIILAVASPDVLCAKEKTMSVQVKLTQMRSTPSFTGYVLTNLNYADIVDLLEIKGKWLRCRDKKSKTEGWIHLSALSAKQIVLSPGQQTNTGVDSSEVALAGKGFNSLIESQYKTDSNLNYTWVNRMETYRVSPDECIEFLKAGGLEEKSK